MTGFPDDDVAEAGGLLEGTADWVGNVRCQREESGRGTVAS